jgi:hypothetical protein
LISKKEEMVGKPYQEDREEKWGMNQGRVTQGHPEVP